MNEQINQLRLEAGISRLHDEPKFMVAVSKEGTVIEPLDGLQKFAELIVKQCGYYADIFESLGCPVDIDPTETKPSDYIKKHFGVEE